MTEEEFYKVISEFGLEKLEKIVRLGKKAQRKVGHSSYSDLARYYFLIRGGSCAKWGRGIPHPKHLK